MAMISQRAKRAVPTTTSAESSTSLPSLKNVSSVNPKRAQNIVFSDIQKLKHWKDDVILTISSSTNRGLRR